MPFRFYSSSIGPKKNPLELQSVEAFSISTPRFDLILDEVARGLNWLIPHSLQGQKIDVGLGVDGPGVARGVA